MRLAVPRLAVAAAIVLAMLAAGCSSGGAPTSDPTPEPTATPTSTPAETSNPDEDQRVVYVSPEFFVFTINRDGTERRRIAGEGDVMDIGPGATMIFPPGVRHYFRVTGDRPMKTYGVHASPDRIIQRDTAEKP